MPDGVIIEGTNLYSPERVYKVKSADWSRSPDGADDILQPRIIQEIEIARRIDAILRKNDLEPKHCFLTDDILIARDIERVGEDDGSNVRHLQQRGVGIVQIREGLGYGSELLESEFVEKATSLVEVLRQKTIGNDRFRITTNGRNIRDSLDKKKDTIPLLGYADHPGLSQL